MGWFSWLDTSWAFVPLVDVGGGEQLSLNPTTGTDHEQKADFITVLCLTVYGLVHDKEPLRLFDYSDDSIPLAGVCWIVPVIMILISKLAIALT